MGCDRTNHQRDGAVAASRSSGAGKGQRTLKVAVFSDVHGNAVALEAVLTDIERQAPQATVCAGDLALGGPEPDACLVRVRAAIGIQCVRGNTDEFFAEDSRAPDEPLIEWTRRRLQPGARAWLANRPFEHRVDDLLVVHATPWSVTDIVPKNAGLETLRRVLAHGRAAAVVYGHIHQSWIGEVPGSGIVVNTGSVGVPFDGDPRASYAVLERGPSGWMAELRRVTYDIERRSQRSRPAIRRARSGRQ